MGLRSIKDQLINHFLSFRNEETAEQMSKYMRNKFDFIGLKKPQRQSCCREFWSDREVPQGEDLIELVSELWKSPFREVHYHALDLMYSQIKQADINWINLWEGMILTNSWWDSVDYLAPRLIGNVFLREPEQAVIYSKKWIESDNFWLQRTAIIFQLHYKDKTDEDILFNSVLLRADSKEFFVQKGSGWALRQYSKTAGEVVKCFIGENENKLSKLTCREGLKWLKSKGKL